MCVCECTNILVAEVGGVRQNYSGCDPINFWVLHRINNRKSTESQINKSTILIDIKISNTFHRDYNHKN